MTTPKIETTHKATQELGPSVQNNRLIWTSASGLTKGDTESAGGCLRSWWFDQVAGKRGPSTKAQERGTALHDNIEGHLVRGLPLTDPLAIAAKEYIPEPGPGILVETPLHVGTDGHITGAYLYAGPVPIAGHVDLWNHRGIYVNAEGELIVEPRPNTFETKDWKTTSDFKWAKTAAELANNIQLVTYAEAGFRMWPHLEHARLTHVYFRTRGAAKGKLVTSLRDREQISRRWEYVDALGRTLADVARETNPDKVPGNRHACGAYNGCPHASYCSVGSFDSLAELFGSRSAEQLLARVEGNTQPEISMALIDKLSPEVLAAAQAGTSLLTTPPAAPAPAAPPAMTPPPMITQMPAAAGVGVQINMQAAVDAETQRLAAEEAARRAQTAAGIPPGFAQAVASIDAAGRGAPPYVGRAAIAIAQLKGIALQPGQGFSGGGWLGERVKNAIEDPALVLQLAAEVSSLPPLPVAAPVPPAPAPAAPPPVAPAPAISVMPPDAPASNPALAALPVDGFDNAKSRELAALTTPTISGLTDTAQAVAATGQLPAPMMMQAAPAVGTVPPQPAAPVPAAVPPQAPAPIPAAVPATTTASSTEAAPHKAGPGRGKRGPRKPKDATTTAGVPACTYDDECTTINLFVDCIPAHPYERLEPYINKLERALAAQYQAADIRCAPKDGPLGYDKWTGALAAFVRQSPPAAGHYVVKASGCRLAQVVVEVLRNIIDEQGGQLVEGVTW